MYQRYERSVILYPITHYMIKLEIIIDKFLVLIISYSVILYSWQQLTEIV